jgi:hypothetical protein
MAPDTTLPKDLKVELAGIWSRFKTALAWPAQPIGMTVTFNSR